MIGVIADSADREVVQEFFELFKTPWEFYRGDREYDVLLCGGDGEFPATAKLAVVYAGRRISFDDQQHIPILPQQKQSSLLALRGRRLPIYGQTATFEKNGPALLADEVNQDSAAYLATREGKMVARIGYDLFREVRTLLTAGQPLAYATSPTLELHIELLRGLIAGAGLGLLEIPPAPEGHPFMVCLTHDVDHPAIRQHRWDHTAFGFFYRATWGSFGRLIRRQMPWRDVLTNWGAALKLPLVYAGLAADFWQQFADRYLELEKGRPSTFFVIPFRDEPGKSAQGLTPSFRAARYAAKDIANVLERLRAAGHEVGLHGIDAWIDGGRGSQEFREIREVTKTSEIGVRMHWLYFDENSPAVLEKAGAAYDSTVGYNEAVGYRAGTTQVYKHLDTARLLELPLHVMDTALFYPTRMEASRSQASSILRSMADDIARYGGVLTINWHDRSVVPERLWDACYRDLLADLHSRGAWFCTAGQAVSWFQKRRSVTFEIDSRGNPVACLKLAAGREEALPALRLRTYKAAASEPTMGRPSYDYADTPILENVETGVPSGAGL